MSADKTSRDFMVDLNEHLSRGEIGIYSNTDPVLVDVKQYGDAELYRIIVAKAIHEGRFNTKAEFDAAARRLGTIDNADDVIRFSTRRPGCRAWRRGDRMICDCGVSWSASDNNPPYCNDANG